MFQVKYDGQLRTEQDVHSLACDVHCLRVQKSNSGANKFMNWTYGGCHGSRYFMVVEIINQNKCQVAGRWQSGLSETQLLVKVRWVITQVYLFLTLFINLK